VILSGKDRFHYARHYKNDDFVYFLGSFGQVVTVCWDRKANYFHIVHDMFLPLVYLPDFLLRDPAVKFVFPNLLPGCWQMLELLGLGNRIIVLNNEEFIFARHVYYWVNYWWVCDSPEAACKFRDLFRDLLGLGAQRPNMSMWLNRNRGLTRHIWNGDEVIQVLATNWPMMNWTVGSNCRNIAETARMFNRLWCVMAPHGAALTNLLFMQNGTGYCEIQSDISAVNFIQMARVLNLWSLLVRIPHMRHFTGTFVDEHFRKSILPREAIMKIGELSAYLIMKTMADQRPNYTYINTEITVQPASIVL
jgi:capsular polysaccharide biosynthesis protein